ncbi:MAG: dihydrolipoyl dehydrogenase, partial [Planctomycetota bacterium]
RAIASGAPDGFVKVIAAGKHREVVGVHIVGARATELVSECALAIEMRATARELAETVHPHPTFSEALMECAGAILGEGIHS